MRTSWILILPAAALLAAASLLPVATPGEEDDGPPAPRVVATLGDEAVTAADLVAWWYDRDRDGWVRTMEALLDERIVRHEVRRLGLSLPPGVLEKAVDEEIDARRKLLAQTYGEGVRLEEEVERGYGVDLETWKREILAPRVRMQHLLMRVVRLDTRRRDRVKARVIVLDDEERARRVRGRLESGADFSLTALKESVDPTAQAGGDLPAIARGDLTVPNVEELLFAASPGDLLGPIAVTIAGRTQWHLYKVIERLPAWTGTRAELLARLETDLAEQPLGRAEFERWRARMRRDFRTRVYDPQGRPVTLPSTGR